MDDDQKLLLGGVLRFGYEILKANLKEEDKEDFFDFAESFGKDAREILEQNPKYKRIFEGADLIRKGKEFWENVSETYLEQED